MITDVTNSIETTPVSTNTKKRKEIEPRSWVWLSYASKTSKVSARCNICSKITTIYNRSPYEYSSIKNALKVELNNVKFVSITTDIWTSIAQISYLGSTVHYLDPRNFILRNRVFGLIYLNDGHDRYYLSNKIKTTIDEWKIYDKVVAFVSDSASNMKSALESFDGKI
ncbi:unnamed protein product [Brachionus calyciflorus]|uniref:Uncharacterized protein n=1 Tax=Brachionus calyciflorus TaxID=104777 RepID=A0A814QE33_9BILA|nr:unnamed protein product [Brachionus calyciflorus]